MEPGSNGFGVPLKASSARQLLLLKPADDDFSGKWTQWALPSPAAKREREGGKKSQEGREAVRKKSRRKEKRKGREKERKEEEGEEGEATGRMNMCDTHTHAMKGLQGDGSLRALCRLKCSSYYFSPESTVVTCFKETHMGGSKKRIQEDV